PQAVIRIDDVARSREHARYEAEKKRRAAGKPAPDVAEQTQARASQVLVGEEPSTRLSGDTRAEVVWSAPRGQTASATPIEVGSSPRVNVSDGLRGPAAGEIR